MAGGSGTNAAHAQPVTRMLAVSTHLVRYLHSATLFVNSEEPQSVRLPLQEYLESMLASLLSVDGGNVATYIPELAKADPARLKQSNQLIGALVS